MCGLCLCSRDSAETVRTWGTVGNINIEAKESVRRYFKVFAVASTFNACLSDYLNKVYARYDKGAISAYFEHGFGLEACIYSNLAASGITPYYYRSSDGSAEIDLIVLFRGRAFCCEIKMNSDYKPRYVKHLKSPAVIEDVQFYTRTTAEPVKAIIYRGITSYSSSPKGGVFRGKSEYDNS